VENAKAKVKKGSALHRRELFKTGGGNPIKPATFSGENEDIIQCVTHGVAFVCLWSCRC